MSIDSPAIFVPESVQKQLRKVTYQRRYNSTVEPAAPNATSFEADTDKTFSPMLEIEEL